MNKETLDALADAISDVGSWQWWYTAKDMFQLEFCDVMMYDETKAENAPHSSVIALRFFGNSFAVFLDELEEDGEKTWFDRLHDDEIPPFPADAYELRFNDPGFARSLLEAYPNKTPMKDYAGPESFSAAGCLLAAKCGEVAFVVGGDELEVVGKKGKYGEEEILPAIKKWWAYWKDYWRKRKTRDAYEKDWACETTIPVNRDDPQGNW
jgi:hypothetical protein